MEFGWGVEYYIDSYSKFSYLLCMLGSVNNIYTWCESFDNYDDFRSQFERTSEWDELNNFIISHLGCDGIYIDSFEGYIDHQSHEYYNSVQEFLDDYEVSMEDFVFNDNVKLIIDNDNH